MKKNDSNDEQRLYLGVDVGGTKVQSSLVRESGEIIGREKCPTPRKKGPERVVAAIEKCMDDAAAQERHQPQRPDGHRHRRAGRGRSRSGHGGGGAEHAIDGRGPRARCWRPASRPPSSSATTATSAPWAKPGSARPAKPQRALYICVGTGIGSGLVQRGRLWRGDRDSAGEIGHIMMQIGGPKCGCGGHGCFEALASRTAIERDLREAIAGGRKSVLTELAGGDLSVIRSGMIRKALEVEDELVTEVLHRAAEVLGHACVNIRHLIDPEAIVLGGGVIEACSDFIMPIVENVVGLDPLPGAREGGRVLLSALGDDAVVLGRRGRRPKAGRPQPVQKTVSRQAERTRKSAASGYGEITVGRKTYSRDIYIYVNGKVKRRDKRLAKEHYGSAHTVGPKELEKVCRGGPEMLFIGAGKSNKVELTEDARRFLAQRSIQCEIQPTVKAVESYNRSKLRKAALIHVTC